MTIEIPLGRIVKYFLVLLLIAFLLGSYPANWWMMRRNMGFYALTPRWEEVLRNQGRVNIHDYENRRDAPDNSCRAWALVFSPLVLPANAVYWVAGTSISFEKS